jgi:hypothetical protein
LVIYSLRSRFTSNFVYKACFSGDVRSWLMVRFEMKRFAPLCVETRERVYSWRSWLLCVCVCSRARGFRATFPEDASSGRGWKLVSFYP